MAELQFEQARRRPVRRRTTDWRGLVVALAFVLPALALVTGLTIYPLGFAAVVSAFDYDLVSQTAYFVGWDNFVALADGAYIHSALVTLVYVATAVGLELVLGVALAMLLQSPVLGRARPVLLAIMLMPLLMAPVVSSATMKLLLNPDFGLVSHALGGLDLLGNRSWALMALIAMDVWMWTPFVVLLVIAARLGIPDQVLEAAALDGATPWQQFRYIILPLIRPILLIIILFRVIDAVKIADIPYVMTQGGPGSATDLISLLIFRTSFGTFNIGLGAAMSMVLILVLMLPVLALYRLMARPTAKG